MTQLGEAVVPIRATMEKLDKDLAASRSKIQKAMDDVKKGVAIGLGVNLSETIANTIQAAIKAVVDFVDQSLKKFKEFQKGMAEVFTLMPGLTERAMGKMEGDVLRFGARVGRLSSETVPALYQSISAGVPRENVFDFMQVASDLALGGVSSLETGVDTLSTVVNAYGAENISALETSDLLFTAVKGGKTTVDELGASLFQVIPTAASLDLEFGNVTAAMASMTAQGTPTAQSATQLRQLLVELSKEGSEAAATFERVAGQSFVEFIAQGGNLQQALQLMEQAAADGNVRLSDLFSSVEAGNAALTLTGAGTAKFATELAAAEDASGATDAAAALMNETVEQAERRAAAAAEKFMILVGEGLEPTRKGFLDVKAAALELVSAQLEQGKVEDFAKDNLLQYVDQLEFARGAMVGYGNEHRDVSAIMRAVSQETLELGAATLDAARQTERAIIAQELLEAGFRGTIPELQDLINRFEGLTPDVQARMLEDFTSNLGTANSAIVTLGDDLGKAEFRMLKFGDSTVEATGAVADLAETNPELADKLDQTNNQLSDYHAGLRAARIESEAAAAATDAHSAAVAAFNESLKQNFLDTINSSDGIGFFNESMGELGQHSAFVSDLTNQQADDLGRLQDAYDKAAGVVHDYEIGLRGQGMTQDEINEKIAEQQEIMAGLAPTIDELNAVGGEYVTWTQNATVNQGAVNQAIFDAVAATDVSAAGLAILGGALGLYSEDAVNAALMTAFIQEKIDALAPTFDGTAESAQAIQEQIFGYIETLQGLGPASETAAGSVSETAAALSEHDAALAEKLGVFDEEATTASETAVTAFGDIEEAANTHMPVAASIVDENATAMLTSVEENMEGIVTATGVNLEEAAVTAEGYVVRFGDVGTNIGQTMTSTLLAEGGALSNAAAQIVSDALAAAAAAAEIQSPSRVADWQMMQILAGYINRARESGGDVADALEGVIEGAFGAVDDSISAAGVFGRARDFFAEMLEMEEPLNADQQLQFLREQAAVLDAIRDLGLDPSAILGDITLGLNADVQALLNATENAMEGMIGQIDDGLQDAQEIAESNVEELIEQMRRAEEEIQAAFDAIDETLSAGRRLGGIAEFFAGMIVDPAQEALAGLDEQLAGAAQNVAESLGGFMPDLGGDLGAMIEAAEAAGDMDAVNALREYQKLQAQRNAAEEEFIAAQERLLEIQEQQQQLAFLQQQLDLIEQLRQAGLNPAEVLAGINLGLGASPADLLAASQAALAALIGQANTQLGQLPGLGNMTPPLIGPPQFFQGGQAATALATAGEDFLAQMMATENQMATWTPGSPFSAAQGDPDEDDGGNEYHYHLHLSGPAAESRGVIRDFALLRAMAGAE